ncbi:MAG: ribosome biogenesis GTPase Der [Proteobacteria bacterium]|nr:ribosome biogenesis GTPase Der [Pseudomonadota bacterium]
MKERLPIVALVGRPNVGKSRLFNRFVRSRMAIVENTPGVTRDRNYGTAHWNDCKFTVIDTGGFEPESTDILLEQMRVQAQLAVEEADVILFVVDARAGLLPADQQIAEILRRSNKRIILCVNKIDQHKLIELSYEFYELAFDEMIPISAEHGLNWDELIDSVTQDFEKNDDEKDRRAKFVIDNDFGEFTEEYAQEFGEYPKGYVPPEDEDELDVDDLFEDDEDDESEEEFEDDEDSEADEDSQPSDEPEFYEVPATQYDEAALAERVLSETIYIAVLGKPNTGKSTLINRLLGYKRLLTADIAGTTRDTIDSDLEGPDGQQYVLIDTAGIRKKSAVSQRIEKFSIVKALDAVERADVVLLVIDAQVGVTEQDLKIASLAIDRGCAVAVLLNKWDAIAGKSDQTASEYIKATRERMSFIDHVPVFTISALTGQRTHKILDIAKKLYTTASSRVPTGELNRVFRRILEQHTPPTVGSRNLKFYFAQQVAIRPPTFVLQCNAPEIVPTDYKRYLINQIRAYYGFEGTPIKVLFKKPAGRRKWEKKK